MNPDDVVPFEQDKDIDEQYQAHLQEERRRKADLYCRSVTVPPDVEMLDAPSALQADFASEVDGEGD